MNERLVFVYKSTKKARTYLYVKEKDVFAQVPAALMDAFGDPKFVMMFALSKRKSLPKISPAELAQALDDKGYFLRIDLQSEEENLLNLERKRLGLPPLEHDEIKEFFQ